jgi:hypothetical protein
MKVPPELRVDALKLKDELQAKLDEKLRGLPPEEELRKMREIVEEGPLGDFWRRLGPSDAAAHRSPAPTAGRT